MDAAKSRSRGSRPIFVSSCFWSVTREFYRYLLSSPGPSSTLHSAKRPSCICNRRVHLPAPQAASAALRSLEGRLTCLVTRLVRR
ncbi:hypothetical protein Naga_100016g86 [Nannochloropsis gaditana]|uniref:Uncharacterized protein n=1 Tax=Nannochloropsis gaditana TaxID=72520 RepID=W7TWU5_9STRA|nr:hypothetical protein Naga_100016g86 [Nannochloropsis gaditana]